MQGSKSGLNTPERNLDEESAPAAMIDMKYFDRPDLGKANTGSESETDRQ